MATLLWQRDLSTDASGVKTTFSSWDSCMTEAYCKWPAIIGIIIAALIVLSLVSCCNKDGYQQAPPPQPAFQPYPQYQSAPPPMYASGEAGGYRGAPAQTATFAAPNKYNPDALAHMPSWDTAASKHVEDDDVEMEKLNYPQAQQQSLLPSHGNGGFYNQQREAQTGDVGTMHANPYHDYDRHQQFVASPTSTARTSAYPPTYHTSPTSTVYEPARQQRAGYAPSVLPSYRTGPPSIASPPPQHPQIGRKPVQGTWRDV
ncbi:hypothetical protein LTR36_000356 [Oleoguttula mirabilis]|uniref:Uncharacterized protein n=1 Tax=Oleoguttula mirabilis TaxID=1507867 RepID=A0AAV9K0D0_9PEZI|nr:hypothetical protein LTR36_000356 [Oleoguttula mirabilis]